MPGFHYVLVPCSASDEMQELTFETDIDALEKDIFREHVEKYFRALGQSVDRAVLLEQLKQRTGVDLKDQKMSGEAMEALLQSTSVEIFPLMLPTPATEYQAISVYCDDKGIAKGLEENARMTGLAHACGYVNQTFRGDCFVGRVFDDTEDEWRRVDFTLADCNSDATWVAQCRQQRSNKSSGDMKSLADKMGMNNPASIMGNSLPGEAASGDTQHYTWRQADDEVEVTLKTEGLTAGDKKKVKVVFTRKHLKVEVKGDVLIDSDLYAAVYPDESTWTLHDGELQVMLTKANDEEWPQLEAE